MKTSMSDTTAYRDICRRAAADVWVWGSKQVKP